MTEEWQTQKFRQNIVAKIHDLLQNSLQDPTKNATVMESSIFKKSRSKEEYLGWVAKLYMHYRDMNNRAGKPQAQGSEMPNTSMPDPINALQNLATQGSRNPQMMAGMAAQNNQLPPNSMMGGNVAASNLLQTLTQQQRQGQPMSNIQGMRQINVPMSSNMQQSNVGPAGIPPPGGVNPVNMGSPMNMNMNAMGNQPNCLPGQMNQMNPNQINPNQMNPNQMNPNQMNANQMNPNQMNPNQMNPNQINTSQMQMPQGMPSQPMNTMNSMQQMPINPISQNQMGMNHPQINQVIGRMNTNQVNMPAGLNQNALPNQINPPGNVSNINPQAQMNQSGINCVNQTPLNQPTAQINVPVSNTAMFQGNRNVGQNQFLRQSPSPTVSSPANISQHQTQMTPSPAIGSSPSPQMANIMTNSQRVALKQSPNAPTSTPGPTNTSSPFNPQEDQMYREKYKQLTKYIEPLKRMVAKIGNNDVEKISKMNKLLEILCNPQQRIPLETLLKCEKALEKMDISLCVSQGSHFGSNNPLLEAVNATLQSPLANHTFHRTFRPSLEALFGSDITPISNIAKKDRTVRDESTINSEIPHVLQGEIARLDQKFKITVYLSSQTNNKTIKLTCCLDDRKLPCVPPICVNIPENYPFAAPSCSLTEHEYSATPFLLAVRNALISRIKKLPKIYSLSHLLDTWEMSVRQACSPNSEQQQQHHQYQQQSSFDLAIELGAIIPEKDSEMKSN